MAPSNPLGMPGGAYGAPQGAGSITLSPQLLEGILPRIPNLEFGYQYGFGNKVSTGRFTLDYLFPVNFGTSAAAFAEVHCEFQNFWKTLRSLFVTGDTATSLTGINDRVDFSAGGGFRKFFGQSTLLGFNAFYDGSRISNQWYSSGSVGCEMAAILPGEAAIDANFNWYGNLFNQNTWANAFRNFGGSYDFEVGYSHPILEETLDLRLKAAGYQFDVGSKVYGVRGGADLTTRDGMFSVKYEYGTDAINGSYNTIGGFVNVGLQLENLLSGRSPFTMPQPVFVNPRNLAYMLTQKAKRNWHMPATVVMAKSTSLAGEGGLTRFLLSVPMYYCGAESVWLSGDATNVYYQFLPTVPVGSLDPTKQIRVTLTYSFVPPAPVGTTISVDVADENGTRSCGGAASVTALNNTGGFVPIGDLSSDTMTFTLSTGWPSSNQSAFTSTGSKPGTLVVGFWGVPAPPGQTVTITNVTIMFNQ